MSKDSTVEFEKEFSNEIVKKKFTSCNFIFFTHYINRDICRSCNFKKQHGEKWVD